VYLASILGGIALAAAWLLPETVASAILGWVAASLLVFALRSRRAHLPIYCGGLVGHALGFYWVFGTVSAFGGFGAVPAALIFALFVASGAVQFLLLALIHHQLDGPFDALALRSATAAVISELVTIRLFRWHFGHTQIAFTPFVQVAGIGGAMLVTFLMFWLAEAGVRAIVFRERRRAFLLPAVAFVLALGYGAAMIRTFASPGGEAQEVVLVQGNAPAAGRRDLASARRNLARIWGLSRSASRAGALIIWPEGSVPAYIPEDVGSVEDGPALPWIGDGSAFLVGAYSFDRDANRYNAAFAVRPDGMVPRPYFKRILIPFGEYMPFASLLPWLGRLNAKAGVFAAGTEVKVFAYPMRRGDGTAYTLRVAPLICYEDTVPALARAATLGGAELLVNLTSDSWFGRSAALHQHHLIAAFRAIESRRYLVRATSTGLSGVVDPLGRTIARLPIASEGTVTARVGISRYRGAYANFVGEKPWWALLTTSIVAIALRWGRGIGRGGRIGGATPMPQGAPTARGT
jgi:apolipoprotein N-acyltransferase